MSSETDWRDATLDRLRTWIAEADPEAVETVKWRKPGNPAGVPVWEHDGIICTGERYKAKVRLTFPHGAKIADPTGMLDPGNGKTRAALDLAEGELPDEAAFKALVKAAAAYNRGQ
jgi:hypothetical protein